MTDETSIEEFRMQLNAQLREDFLDKLKNPEDPVAERDAILGLVGDSLKRLIEIEAGFLSDLLVDADDGLCPGCLIKDATDVANAKSVAHAFNHYLSSTSNMHH